MKEKEAKKIAAKKRLEEKNKKKTEEENAVRKGEALQVSSSGPGSALSSVSTCAGMKGFVPVSSQKSHGK